MKKTFLLSVLLFSFQAYTQETKFPKLPKIRDHLRKDVGRSFRVKWSCPQEQYKEIAQLTQEADVEVYLNKKGEVSYRPNVFKIKPLSKEFIQGLNPLKLLKKDVTYKVDYSDCVSDFYKNVENEFQTFQNSCEGDPAEICQLDSDDFMTKTKESIESSRYLAVKDNTVIIPRSLPGSGVIELSSESALGHLKDFCETGTIESKVELLSGSVVLEVQKRSNMHIDSFPGIDCINKYENFLKEEIKEIKEVHCAEGKRTPVCRKVTERDNTITSILNQSITKVKMAVERTQKFFEAQYGKDAKDVDEHLKTKFKIPEGNCHNSNWASINNRHINIAQFDQEISSNLDTMFSEGSAECQQQFLQNYISVKIQKGIDDKKFDEFCKLHQTKYCKSMQANREVALSNIERMFKLVHGDIGEKFYNEEVACHVEEENSILDILGKLKDNEKGLRCKELENGDFKNITWRQNPDVRSGDYMLKKVGDNKFEAYFNLNFKSDEGARTTPQEMLGRVKECMAMVSPYMKGPNGEELAIKILDGDKELSELPLNQRPKKIDIGIAPKGFRSHSKMYEEDIDCPVLTHEVLHLFGLCDEYKEKWLGEGKNYDCRVVPTGPSVMKNQNEMFGIAVDQSMSCDCSSPMCQNVMKSDNPDKVELYLGHSISDITSYKDRGDYCKSSRLPNAKFSSLKASKTLEVTSSTSEKLVIISNAFVSDNLETVSQTKLDCSCGPSDKACREFLTQTKVAIENATNETRGICPSGTKSKSREYTSKGKESFSYDDSSKTLTLNRKAKEPSLLHPSHFERIIGGSCEDKAKIYLECSKFAYSNGPCEVPAYCQDSSKYLGTKQ